MQQQMLCGDETHAVVADIGAAASKFGSAGQDLPRYVLKSHIGEVNDPNAPGGRRCIFSDTGLRTIREDLMVHRLHIGTATRWEHIERLLHFGIGSYMRLPTAEVPILFADNTITGATGDCDSSNADKKKLMEVCFESLHSPAMYMVSSGVLSSFSTGRPTSLVVDIGAQGTRIMPVVDGYELRSCSVFTQRGGNLLDEMLLREMDAQLQKSTLRRTASASSAATAASGNSQKTAKVGASAGATTANAVIGNHLLKSTARLFDINTSAVRPWFDACKGASLTVPRRLVHSSFREMHMREIAHDLKEWMCFIPYTPILLPQDLQCPEPVSHVPQSSTTKTTSAVAAANAAAVMTAAANAALAYSEAVSVFRLEELQRRSLQFPPPYELPDGQQIVATERLCTTAELMLFERPLPDPVVLVQPLKVARSKSKTLTSSQMQATAAAAASAQAAAAAASAVSRKRARSIMEEQSLLLSSSGSSGAVFDTTVSAVSSSSSNSNLSSMSASSKAQIAAETCSIGSLHGIKVEEESLSDLIYLCVSQCDVDVRRELLGNIQIVGGGSRIEGIAQRLTHELTEIVPSHIKVKVVTALPAERHYAPWIGGSILSICGSFQQLWLTKSEYSEHGPDRTVLRFDH